MIIQILIENLALIENVFLEPGPCLNVLTGETGAGKSIIVDAMSLLIGGRAINEQVRTGTEKALVEGLFDYVDNPQLPAQLAELGLPESEDSTLLLRRELVRNGRSTCRVNGRVVPLALYRALGELLVDLHGQHEHQSLLRIEQHRELLDRFGGAPIIEQRSLVEGLYRQLVDLKVELQQCQLDESTVARRSEYLAYAIKEIKQLHPRPGEEEVLRQERERLRYGERLAELVREALSGLTGGPEDLVPAVDLVSNAAERVQEMGRYDASLQEVTTVLDEIRYKLEDVVETLRQYQERLDFDPATSQQVEDRLYALRNLMQKYGATLDEVCAYGDQAAAELADLQSVSNRVGKLETEYSCKLQEYRQAAEQLSVLRRDCSVDLVASVTSELRSLGMPDAYFDLEWHLSKQPEVFGYDQPEFIFSANPGEPLKPLAKIASGGEMSRVMLALKVILAAVDQIPTLVFDEIDSGIGGRTLQAVGEKLAEVAACKQIFVVTHSPNIACRGQSHFFIEKMVSGEQTRTVVTQLDQGARVDELVRMLGGGSDSITRRHAEQLLRKQ